MITSFTGSTAIALDPLRSVSGPRITRIGATLPCASRENTTIESTVRHDRSRCAPGRRPRGRDACSCVSGPWITRMGGSSPVGAAAEHENRLRELIGDDDLVVDLVVADVVHGAREQRGLSCNRPRRRFPVRQPGECRNLRVSHSIRDEDLVALGVVGDPAGIADRQRLLAERRAANRAQRRDVAVGGRAVNRGASGCPCSTTHSSSFFASRKTPVGIPDPRLRPLDRAHRRHVALCRRR